MPTAWSTVPPSAVVEFDDCLSLMQPQMKKRSTKMHKHVTPVDAKTLAWRFFGAKYLRRAPVSTEVPGRSRGVAALVSTEYPRPSRGVAATRPLRYPRGEGASPLSR